MDTRLLLIRAIVLLYRESQLNLRSDGSAGLVTEVLATIRGPAAQLNTEFGKDVITYLRNTVEWMMSSTATGPFERQAIIDRVRVGTNGHEYLYEMILEGMDDLKEGPDQDFITEQCETIRKEFNEYIRQTRIKSIMTDFHRRAAYGDKHVDWSSYAKELRQELEPYESTNDNAALHPSVVTSIDFSNIEELRAVMESAQDTYSGGTRLRFGLKALNRIFGAMGGAARGEMIMTPALQHSFKSGLNMMMTLWVARFNVPMNIDPDPKVKPCIVRISTENDAITDILTMYKFMYEWDNGHALDITNINPVEAAVYVHEKIAATGWSFKYQVVDPSDWGYHDLFQYMNQLKREGFEVHWLGLDYLAMLSKKNCNIGPAGSEYRDLVRRVRNFTRRNNITVATPWQISTAGKARLREHVSDFLGEIIGKGYYDSCGTIDQEIDTELVIHRIKVGNDWWLGVALGKRRGVSPTPEVDSRFYVPFQKDFGTILEDVNLPEDTSRRTLPSTSFTSSEDDW